MQVTLTEALRLTHTVKATESAIVTRRVLDFALPQDRHRVLQPEELVILYLHEWLTHLGCLDRSQIVGALKRLRMSSRNKVETPLVTNAFSGKTATLTVAGQMLTWEGLDCWYNSDYDQDVKQLSSAPITLIVCDVTALVITKAAWLSKLRNEDASRSAADTFVAENKSPLGDTRITDAQ